MQGCTSAWHGRACRGASGTGCCGWTTMRRLGARPCAQRVPQLLVVLLVVQVQPQVLLPVVVVGVALLQLVLRLVLQLVLPAPSPP